MATLGEFFQGEFGHTMKFDREITFPRDGVIAGKAIGRLYLSFDEYACLLGYYVSEEFATIENLQILIAQYEDSIRLLHEPSRAKSGHPVYDPIGAWSDDLTFTSRVILYVDANLDEASKQSLIAFGSTRGLHIQIRDRSYEEFMNEIEKPLAFMSHDSRDKPFVAELAGKLRSVLCPVWYDEFSLKPGDSLTESIGAGLRDSKRCVVVLSPNFLTNPGWTKAEFNAAMNKHITSGGGVVIPVWHGVTAAQVAEYSPLIADLFAINTDVGVDEVFARLHRVLLADGTKP